MNLRICISMVSFALLSGGACRIASADDGIKFFEKKIRPVLVEHCYECHSSDARKQNNLKANLLLDSQAGMRRGGETGPAVVPGKPLEGTLIAAMRHESYEMPPDGKLPDAVITRFYNVD